MNTKSFVRFLSLLVLTAFTVNCGGSGGDGRDDPATYGISGFVTSAVTGAALASVTVTLSGDASATASTDGTGHYSFSTLMSGSYSVTASHANAAISPNIRAVTIDGANVVGENFLAIQVATVATGIEFLPQSFNSGNQLRASVIVDEDNVIFTDSSDFPLKKQPLDSSSMTPLARRFGTAESVVLHGEDIYWIEAGDLHKTSPDGTTTVLASGQRSPVSDVTADIVVDNAYAYWVDTDPNRIQKVPLGGGATVTLATVDRLVVSLTSDADHLYWEEASMEPLDPGCECGSTIKSVPKAGGATVVLVDGSLNGSLGSVPPGTTPASWLPTGGLALTDTEIVFAAAGGNYELKAVPIPGGSIRTLATVSSVGFARNTIPNIRVDSTNAYWIDSYNRALYSVPLVGGNVTALASDLNRPGALAIDATTAFWTEAGALSESGEGSIRQVPLSGGTISTVVAGLDRPRTLDVDASQLAWNEVWRVAKAPRNGGTTTTIVSGIESDMVRISIAQTNVYVLDGDFIKMVPLAGGTVEKLAPANLGLIGGLSFRGGDIVADDTNIYWTIRKGNGAHIVQKVAISGGTPVILADEAVSPNPQDCYWRTAVNAQNVYWSSGSTTVPIGCAVKYVPINGGAITTLVDHSRLTDFTVDDINVYFSELESGSIQKIPVDGSPIVPVAEGGAGAWVLINDANRLYWISPSGAIAQISKDASTPTSEWVGFPVGVAIDRALAIEGLFVDGNAIYVSETQSGNIYSIF